MKIRVELEPGDPWESASEVLAIINEDLWAGHFKDYVAEPLTKATRSTAAQQQ